MQVEQPTKQHERPVPAPVRPAFGRGCVTDLVPTLLGHGTADHASRSTWLANFLAAGGIEAIAGDGFASSADAGRAFAESGVAVACIASSDQVYSELAEATAGVLKQAGASKIYLAGRPAKQAELRAAGVDGFFSAGQNALDALTALHAQLGIT